jgi:hypothetical protein
LLKVIVPKIVSKIITKNNILHFLSACIILIY